LRALGLRLHITFAQCKISNDIRVLVYFVADDADSADEFEIYDPKGAQARQERRIAVIRCIQIRRAYSFVPLAGWPSRRNVLGYLPAPQILNDPKSLYQGPSGASGSVSRQSFNR
jgi:hypothetical protein